eukprot:jgi/Botrbrau1/12135/Bobra.0186s0051.2
MMSPTLKTSTLGCLVLCVLGFKRNAAADRTFFSSSVTKSTNVYGSGNVVGDVVSVGTINTFNSAPWTISPDPLMQAFDGSLFFFHGQSGAVYDIISQQGAFQVSAQVMRSGPNTGKRVLETAA